MRIVRVGPGSLILLAGRPHHRRTGHHRASAHHSDGRDVGTGETQRLGLAPARRRAGGRRCGRRRSSGTRSRRGDFDPSQHRGPLPGDAWKSSRRWRRPTRCSDVHGRHLSTGIRRVAAAPDRRWAGRSHRAHGRDHRSRPDDYSGADAGFEKPPPRAIRRHRSRMSRFDPIDNEATRARCHSSEMRTWIR
jgi:hypothetical protein